MKPDGARDTRWGEGREWPSAAAGGPFFVCVAKNNLTVFLPEVREFKRHKAYNNHETGSGVCVWAISFPKMNSGRSGTYRGRREAKSLLGFWQKDAHALQHRDTRTSSTHSLSLTFLSHEKNCTLSEPSQNNASSGAIAPATVRYALGLATDFPGRRIAWGRAPAKTTPQSLSGRRCAPAAPAWRAHPQGSTSRSLAEATAWTSSGPRAWTVPPG